MTKKIFEELPARKHAPAKAAPAAAAKGTGNVEGEGSEKKIRQAVYDIRYRARREGIDLRAAYSQYMSNSNLTAPEQAAVRAKLFGKDGGGEKKEVKEFVLPTALAAGALAATAAGALSHRQKMKKKPISDADKKLLDSGARPVRKPQPKLTPGKPAVNMMNSYDATMNDGATSAVAKAMFQVFVEKNIKEEVIQEDETSEKKYKVRVIDEKSGRSYVRYADRQKITELRAKGLKVEMTEHGDPYEGKRERKGGLDPVAKNPAKRDGDVNNDGKKDKTDSYIYNRRDAINKAIEKKKGMKEEFLADGTTSTEGQNTKAVKEGPINNYAGKNPVVTVNPESKSDTNKTNTTARAGIYAHTEVSMTASQRRLMEMIAKKNETPVVEEPVAEGACEPGMKCEKCGKDPCECDTRADRTYREVLKNKLRSMGKRVLAATGDDAEDAYEKMATAAFIKTDKMTGKMEPVSLYGDGKMKKEDYERSPEANTARQEAAKAAAQKAREEKKAAKPQSAIEREGAAQREVERKGKSAMGAALRRNPNLFKGL